MKNCSIGANAGVVWRALNENKLSCDELVKVTGLHPLELACVIG